MSYPEKIGSGAWEWTPRGFWDSPLCMDSLLPPTGTAEFLSLVSPYVPDSFINALVPSPRGRGRRPDFSPAQLWRVHLLSVLTPVHAFNLLVQILPEQRAWRQFARLPNRCAVPDVRMLHQFRERFGVSELRQINEHLLQPLLPPVVTERMSVAMIDATDLEAASSGHKKSVPVAIQPRGRHWARGRSRPDRVASFWATRSTLFGSGSRVTKPECFWCRWLVGSLRPMYPRANCCFRVWRTATGACAGGRTWWSLIWDTLTVRANSGFESAGKCL